jgi:diguanylate cyclase (GGDEF)-like protein
VGAPLNRRTGPGDPGAPWPDLPPILVRLSQALDRRARWQVWGVAGAMLAVAFAADFLTGPHLAWTVAYAVPVSVAAWHLGWRPALAVAMAAAAGVLLASGAAGTPGAPAWAGYWNAAVALVVFLTVAYSLVVLRSALRHERELARTDWLTGLPNTRAFLESASHEVARARRVGSPVTLAYIDLDGFKTVNDAMGHAFGDEFLRQVAGALRSGLRDVDMVARMGGDEFAVLLPDTTAADAAGVLGRLRPAMDQVAAASDWPVRFSVGAVTSAHPMNADDLIRQADAAMYEAKRRGGNQLFLIGAAARAG